MEFCPECGAMLLPKNNKLECSCGYTKNLSKSDTDQYEVSQKVKESENIKMMGDEEITGTGTTAICPECGHDRASYKLLQTRSADEAPTRIFTCMKCKHTWREYD